MNNIALVAHVIICVGIITLVLLQKGKGADMGSGLGGGNSSSLFGASGSANFLSRTTAVFAALFFISSAGLSYLISTQHKSVMAKLPAPIIPASKANAIPVTPLPTQQKEPVANPIDVPMLPTQKAPTEEPQPIKVK